VIIKEPPRDCKNLFNQKIPSDSLAAGLVSEHSGQAKTEESKLENRNLQDRAEIFVASKNSKVYHLPSCKYAKRIKEENKIWFRSEEEAKRMGYRPHSCVLDGK